MPNFIFPFSPLNTRAPDEPDLFLRHFYTNFQKIWKILTASSSESSVT